MVNVILVCGVFLLIFAVIGINFFKGKFYYCDNISDAILETIETKDVSLQILKFYCLGLSTSSRRLEEFKI